MKSKFVAIEFDTVDFPGADGKIHTIRQASLTHREELRDRLSALYKLLQESEEGDLTIIEFYESNEYFHFLCNRCLELAGVALDWVNPNMLPYLLLSHDEGEKFVPGYLVSLNFPPSNQDGKGSSYEEVIAVLWAATGELEKAIKLAQEQPTSELLAVLEARNELQKKSTPEGAKKAMIETGQNRALEKIQEMRRQKGIE
jgi:hypothetical protein